ncbi:MAG: NAD-dependent epimerase/dehydratase family protein [Acidimicrobiia bacterium]
MLEDLRILITGGAGFIGSHLAERLLDDNDVTIFDNFSRDALTSTDVLHHRRLELIEGDILDIDAVTRAVEGQDVIFHCAAIAGIDTVGKKPVTTLKVNILGSVNVLDAASESPAVERIVCFSTSEVYGRHAREASEEADARVGPPGEPRWTYAAGKLAEEHLAAAYHVERGLPTVVLRPFNVYGPRQVGEGAIRSFILKALTGEPLEIRGAGDAVRAWTYISDMVDGACAAASRDEAIGNHFNIGNPNEPVTVSMLARQIVELTSSPSEIVHLPASSIDVVERAPDLSKSRRLLGFEPRVDLADGIRLTIKAMQESL